MISTHFTNHYEEEASQAKKFMMLIMLSWTKSEKMNGQEEQVTEEDIETS